MPPVTSGVSVAHDSGAARADNGEMDRIAAKLELPEPYAVAPRLREEATNATIAARLNMVIEAIGPLLRLAEAKLANILTPP
jgi:hypothetical protein